MDHPLDDWMRKLRPLNHGYLKAYVVDGWPFAEGFDISECRPDQVRLARMVLRPNEGEELKEFISDSFGIYLDPSSEEEELEPEEKQMTEAWTCSETTPSLTSGKIAKSTPE